MKITNIKQITTETGDKGYTRNLANEVILKDDPLFAILGTMDELSSVLGVVYHHSHLEFIKTIQKTMQTINTGLAFNPDSQIKLPTSWESFSEKDVVFIEKEEQRLLDKKPIEAVFSLPGSEGTEAGAYFDWARTVCRRAEREMVHYVQVSGRTDLQVALKYINRLSDLLFIIAKNA
ncbi:MAG: cob(I)yrinic acid a,c-diamide adenosyltransferase [Candidatus Izemoplasmatales bacterium]|nr:cob(I)yrinic acid a,c-diamide adenosyltransferase [Candidatus Izemoplasmatales bacterium]MDD3865780.1 cob(I)yrinic acid a,c-diamide adenosyltransferase [Candidatus Izemoplasmatales bacterium]